MTHEPATLNGKLRKHRRDAAKALRRAQLVDSEAKRRQGVTIEPGPARPRFTRPVVFNDAVAR